MVMRITVVAASLCVLATGALPHFDTSGSVLYENADDSGRAARGKYRIQRYSADVRDETRRRTGEMLTVRVVDKDGVSVAERALTHARSASSLQHAPLHVTSAALQGTRPNVAWVHLHKCAGSSICDLALANNETSLYSSNCNLENDGCGLSSWVNVSDWLTPRPQSKTCDQRMASARTFMGVERWTDADMCDTTQLLYGTMMRDPLDRLVSNTEYARAQVAAHAWTASSEEIVDLVRTNATGCVNMTDWLACAEAGHCDLIERSTAAYDNFYTRTFAGPDAFLLPAGALTSEHLERAKARLASFDVVLLLERLDVHSVQLSKFGWKQLVLPESNVNDDSLVPTDDHLDADDTVTFTEEQMDVLWAANALDVELYVYAASLAANRTLVAELAAQR